MEWGNIHVEVRKNRFVTGWGQGNVICMVNVKMTRGRNACSWRMQRRRAGTGTMSALL